MKLGGSLERSRKKRRRRTGGDADTREERRAAAGSGFDRRRLLGWLAGLAFVGWFFGYFLATRIFFPAPPPPGDA